MSFFIKDTFATVWDSELKEKLAKVRIGTSEKNQQGQYVNSNWFATFVGKAFQKADSLEPRDRIKILLGKIQNVSVKQPSVEGKKPTYKTYLNVVVYDFEKQRGNRVEGEPNEDNAPILEDEMPF